MTTDTQIIDYSPGLFDLVGIVPGRSLAWTVLFFEEDDVTEIDITGDTFDCEIKDMAGNLIVAITSGSGITQTDTNEITCSIDETVTAAFDHEKTYRYQVNWNTGGDVYPSAYGSLDFLEPIIT